jgi:hypothetical protein
MKTREKIDKIDFLSLSLLTFYPLALILGNLIINSFILLFLIGFFYKFKDNSLFLKQKNFYLILFFFLSLLVNLIFSSNPINSFPRIIKLLFIIFFIIETQRIVLKYEKNYMEHVYRIWFIIFIIISIDILIELNFGVNSLGMKSSMLGRIASFFGDELVVGAYYHGFVLFFLSYLFSRNSNNYILILSTLGVIIISFLIGERSNFIKVFISVMIFISLVSKINYKIKITYMVMTVISIITIINFTPNLNHLNKQFEHFSTRYYEIKEIFVEGGYTNYIKKSQHGAHRNAAIKILEDNLYFGVGVKNFRHESAKEKYENKEYSLTSRRYATHPHQIHYEFLSETGLFGYLSLLIFLILSLTFAINRYLKVRNIYQLSGIIFVITSVLPILPSGSFLSTFSGGIFWINYAIMCGYINKTKF